MTDRERRIKRLVFAAGVTAVAALRLRQRAKQQAKYAHRRDAGDGAALLARAAPLLRLPTSPDRVPDVVTPTGETDRHGSTGQAGLRCPVTGRLYPYRDGIVWLLDTGLDGQRPATITQKALDTPLTAWAYDHVRELITAALGVLPFPEEVAFTQETLQVTAGDLVFDLACGHGNFTVEWAKRAGSEGLVLGLDYSPAMLARAVHHVRAWGLDNVLLIHGDAHALPFADGALEASTSSRACRKRCGRSHA